MGEACSTLSPVWDCLQAMPDRSRSDLSSLQNQHDTSEVNRAPDPVVFGDELLAGEISERKSTMTWDTLQQFVRSGVQLVSGYLIGSGLINEEGGELVMGVALSVAAFGWWLYWWVNGEEAAE